MLAQSVNHVTLDSYSPPYYSHLNFNPRPREEGDALFYTANSLARYISIHALVKRATAFRCVCIRAINIFQSTPSWRGRLSPRDNSFLIKLFQSTPSWRGRPILTATTACRLRFQSTPSWRGRQFSRFFTSLSSSISIHALVKRATAGNSRWIQKQNISIHALVKRATGNF